MMYENRVDETFQKNHCHVCGKVSRHAHLGFCKLFAIEICTANTFSQLLSPISTLKWVVSLRLCFSLLQLKYSLQKSSVELLLWNVVAGESDHHPVTISSCGLYTCVMFCFLSC